MSDEGREAYIYYYLALYPKNMAAAIKAWEKLTNKELWNGMANAAIQQHLAEAPSAAPEAPGKWSPLDKVTIKPDWMDITKDLVSG